MTTFLQILITAIALAGMLLIVLGYKDIRDHSTGTPKATVLTAVGALVVYLAAPAYLAVSDGLSAPAAIIWVVLLLGSLALVVNNVKLTRQYTEVGYQIQLEDLRRMRRSHGDG